LEQESVLKAPCSSVLQAHHTRLTGAEQGLHRHPNNIIEEFRINRQHQRNVVQANKLKNPASLGKSLNNITPMTARKPLRPSTHISYT